MYIICNSLDIMIRAAVCIAILEGCINIKSLIFVQLYEMTATVTDFFF